MARPISDEEVQLKKRARRRLIGAIAIVTAVVVALPMVLDNEPKPVSQEIDVRIPSQDSAGPFISKIVPIPDTSPAPDKPAAEAKPDAKPVARPAPQPGATTTKPQPPAAEEKPVAKTDKPAASAPAEKAASAAKPETPAGKPGAQSGQYVVQVVALADAAKAKQMQQAILKTGVKAYTEVVKTARGDVTRVRVGPYATREAAEKAQQKLKGAGFDGKVVPTR